MAKKNCLDKVDLPKKLRDHIIGQRVEHLKNGLSETEADLLTAKNLQEKIIAQGNTIHGNKVESKTIEPVHADNIKSKFREVFKSKGVSDEHIDGAIAVMEARSKSWASEKTGRSPEQWYSRIADVKTGEFAENSKDVLYQVLDEVNVFESNNAKAAKDFIDKAFAAAENDKEAQTVYRKLATKYHPDKNPSQTATEIMQHLNNAKDKFSPENISTFSAQSTWEKSDFMKDFEKRYEAEKRQDAQQRQSQQSAEASKPKPKPTFWEKVFGKGEQLTAAERKKRAEEKYTKAVKDAEEKYLAANAKAKAKYEKGVIGKSMAASMEASSIYGMETRNASMEYMTAKNRAHSEYISATMDVHFQFQGEGAKGALETLSDGRMVIHALENPDFSTMVHEIAHVFEKDLTPEEKNVFKDSEVFARGFERYLREGNAPTEHLKTLFEKFKNWLTDIYRSLKGSPIEKNVSPELKKVFDRLLTEQRTGTETAVPENVKPVGQSDAKTTTPVLDDFILNEVADILNDNISDEKKLSRVANIIYEQFDSVVEKLPSSEKVALAALTGDKTNAIKKNGILLQYIKSKINNSNPELVKAVESLLGIELPKSQQNETGKKRDTETIVSSAEAVISQAGQAATAQEVDDALDNIETALNEVNSKIGKLTENYSSEGIAADYPSAVIGKQAKKEITKYAKDIAKLLGWNIPAKNGVHDNIAPAGGEVYFKFDIPGTPFQMQVSAAYEPGYNDRNGYDNYAFNGFRYKVSEIDAKGRSKDLGGNQWQRDNVSAKELAQVLKREADKYIGKATVADIVKETKGQVLIVKPTPDTSQTKQGQRKVRDEVLRKQIDDELKDFFGDSGLLTTGGLDPVKIEKGVKIIGLYMKAGVYKFSDIIEDAYAKFGDKVKDFYDALKTVYGGYYNSQATDEEAAQMTPNLRNLKFDDIVGNYGNEESQPEGLQNSENELHTIIEKSEPQRQFIDTVKQRILNKEKQNIVSLRKLAVSLGIDVKDTTLQEMVEMAVVESSREVAQGNELDADKLAKIIDIYDNQPTISMRSAERIEKQQYSTPAPTAFLSGLYLKGINPQSVFEPSAGNGIMVMNFNPSIVTVNEIDNVRLENLGQQNFATVTNQDALQPFDIGKRDGIIMNPPFGSAPEVVVDGFKISGLDERMIVNALQHLSDNGRAAIIMGGHNRYDDKGRLKSERTFFNYLYHHYNVADVLNMDGALYQKQGTTFPTRLILIDGVKENPEGFAPLGDMNNVPVVKSFEELHNIINNLKAKENGTQNILQSPMDADQRTSNDVHGENTGQQQAGPENISGIPEGQIRTTNNAVNTAEGKPGSNGGRSVRSSSNNEKPNTGGISANNNEQRPVSNVAPNNANGQNGTGNNRTASNAVVPGNQPLQSARKFSTNELSQKEKVTYQPKSKGNPVGTVIPSQMASEAERILTDIENEFGGIDNYVTQKLGYPSTKELFKALSAEQIDAVAMAVKQIELGQGMIIGDMTGVGKGRIAAAVVRYAVNQGQKPIFLTERPNLFSDLYRDLMAIGSEKLVPFIVNDKSADSDPTITDEKGNIVHKVLGKPAKKTIFENKALPESFDFVMATYSQFRSNPSKPSIKKDFFLSVSNGNVLILDESHNVSGDSNSGQLFQDVLANAQGVTYLSATFAKRPDNMPVYAVKTAMQEANMTKDELVSAIELGGVALQEVVSSQLVESGQMLRRERTFEGVDIKYEVLNEIGKEHRQIADNVTEIIRDVIDFQSTHVKELINQMDKEVAGAQGTAGGKKGTSMAGVDNTPFASKVFNVIDQLLFSIKANDVADAAIQELKAGRKPVIGFKSTMESFLKNLDLQPGEKLEKVDFSLTLKRAIEGTMRYTVTDAMGNKSHSQLSLSDLSEEGKQKYEEIIGKIKKASLGITVSPIDVMIKKIKDAGYTVQEITGRSMMLEMNDTGGATVVTRTDKDVKKHSRDFNNGDLDAIMINASGATGISLHASSTFKDQRQRVMIDGQLELDINKAVQKRGRIDRTGQVVRGAYRYIVSAIPAEKRLLMMFKSKLKSLDANTTSSQKSKESDVEVTDFLNKYGDEIVTEYLKEDKEINEKLLDPLKLEGKSEEELDKIIKEDGAARKVTGRVAILNSKDQDVFYREITQRYLDYMEYLESNNSNDLEVKVLPLNATTTKTQTVVVGKGGTTPFGKDSNLETIESDVLKKPMTKSEIDAEVKNNLGTDTPNQSSSKLKDAVDNYYEGFTKREEENVTKDYDSKKDMVTAIATKAAIKSGDDVQTAVHAALEKLESSKQERISRLMNKYENVRKNISRMAGYFKAGSLYEVPTSVRVDTVVGTSKGIFLGFQVKEKSKNPYAPSAIKMRFAVNDGRRVVVVPLSKQDFINAVISNSGFTTADQKQYGIDNWDKLQSNRTREERYMITGNLLQAYGTNKNGQLVSYTDDKGNLNKGMLMPEDYKVYEQKLRVPISQAAKYLQDRRSTITTVDKEVTITKESDGYAIEVPLSKQSGGKYFLDHDLRALLNDRGFNQLGGRMVGYFSDSRLQDVLNHLQTANNSSIEVAGNSKFSAKEAASDFQSNDKTPVTVEALQKKYPDAVVVQKQSELPQSIKDAAKRQNYTVEGALHRGRVYLVADNLSDMGRAEGVYRHETIGHKKVISHLNSKLDKFATSLVDNADKAQGIRLGKLSDNLFGKPVSELSAEEKSTLGQEYIAQAAESPATAPTTWEKVKAFVRGVLRDLGINLAITDRDIKVLLDRVQQERKSSALSKIGAGIIGATSLLNPNAVDSNTKLATHYETKQEAKISKSDTTFIPVVDNREYDAVSEKPITDRNDLSAEGVNSQLVTDIVHEAQKNGIDPYTAIAIAYQETKLGEDEEGETMDNPFRILYHGNEDTLAINHPVKAAIKFLKEKFELAKRLGKQSEAEQIQAWNGYGKIGKLKEGGEEGSNINSWYGIDVSKHNIDMNKRPVYGERVIDVRDNIIKQNPELVKVIEDARKNVPLFKGKLNINTEAFKKWFGNSKIVDEKTKKPLVVYHGTNQQFNEFDKSKQGANTGWDNTKFGFFFIGNEQLAKDFTEENGGGDRIIPAYLSIQNPIDITTRSIFTNAAQAPTLVEIFTGDRLSPKKALAWINEEIGMGELGEAMEGLKTEEAKAIILRDGYDGMISDFGDNNKEYIAFEPNQIKLADGSNTTFNPETNDIRFAAKRKSVKKAQEEAAKNIPPDLKKYADDFIEYVKSKNPAATYEDVVNEMAGDRGSEFDDSEADGLYTYVEAMFGQEPAPDPNAATGTGTKNTEPKKKSDRMKIQDAVSTMGDTGQDAELLGIKHRENVGLDVAVGDVAREDLLVLAIMQGDAIKILNTLKENFGKRYLAKALYAYQHFDKDISPDKRLGFGIAIENEISFMREGSVDNTFSISRPELSRIYAEAQRMNALNSRDASKTLNVSKTRYDTFTNDVAGEELLGPKKFAEKVEILKTLSDETKLDEAAAEHETTGTKTKTTSGKSTSTGRKTAPKPGNTESKLNSILNDLKDELKKLDC